MTDRVLIVGSVALDDVATPRDSRKRVLGGSASYGAIAASFFAPVDIVGVVGDDFPAEHVELLRAHGVNTDGLEVVPGGKTFHWGGEYSPDMNDRATHFTELGVFGEFNPTIPDAYRRDAFLFLANIDPDLQLRVLEQVESPRLTLLDSMNLWINIKRDALMEVLRRVDVALLNDSEALMLFQTHSLIDATRRLLDLGLKRVIIKKGSHGAQMFSREGGLFAVPAIPLDDVRDPTGAGDTFAGGLIGFLAARLSAASSRETAFRQAILVGSACASYVVEDFSVGRLANLPREAILERCDQLHRALSCEAVVV